MRMCLAILIVVMYVGNYPLASWMYPMHNGDYYEFMKFYLFRDKLYEFMFLISFTLLFICSRGISKSIIAFCLVLVSASFVDKVLLNIREYLYTDIVLIIIAAVVAVKVFKNDK